MKDDFSQIMTPLDLSVSSRPLQMTKLLLPFLPPKTQRMMAIYIKFMELQNTLTYFTGFSDSAEDPLEELKKLIPSSAMETYDSLMSMMSMMSMMQEADTLNSIQKEGETNDGLVK